MALSTFDGQIGIVVLRCECGSYSTLHAAVQMILFHGRGKDINGEKYCITLETMHQYCDAMFLCITVRVLYRNVTYVAT